MLIPALTLLAALAFPADEIVYEKINKSSPTQKIAFNSSGLDVNGQPISLQRAEFLFRVHPAPSPLPPAIVLPTSNAPVNGNNEYLVRNVAATLPAGRYAMTVRFVGGGLLSDESNLVYVEVVDEKKPAAPTQLRIVGQP